MLIEVFFSAGWTGVLSRMAMIVAPQSRRDAIYDKMIEVNLQHFAETDCCHVASATRRGAEKLYSRQSAPAEAMAADIDVRERVRAVDDHIAALPRLIPTTNESLAKTALENRAALELR